MQFVPAEGSGQELWLISIYDSEWSRNSTQDKHFTVIVTYIFLQTQHTVELLRDKFIAQN